MSHLPQLAIGRLPGTWYKFTCNYRQSIYDTPPPKQCDEKQKGGPVKFVLFESKISRLLDVP